jgi:hypothetical protein
MIEQMFEDGHLVATDVQRIAAAIRTLGGADADAAELIDQLTALEELKGTVAATQARITASFAGGQRAAQRAAGVSEAKVGGGIAGQVALARRDSPFRGGRHLGLAEALTRGAAAHPGGVDRRADQ